jgi:hypothetical protein
MPALEVTLTPDTAQQLLNQRAAEGWELTAVAGDQGLYFFRRAR